MCNDKECVPGKATLSISLPVAESETPSDVAEMVGKNLAKVPDLVDWKTDLSLDGESVSVTIATPEGIILKAQKLIFTPTRTTFSSNSPFPKSKTARAISLSPSKKTRR